MRTGTGATMKEHKEKNYIMWLWISGVITQLIFAFQLISALTIIIYDMVGIGVGIAILVYLRISQQKLQNENAFSLKKLHNYFSWINLVLLLYGFVAKDERVVLSMSACYLVLAVYASLRTSSIVKPKYDS